MNLFICPICSDKTQTYELLVKENNTLRCSQNHCFDFAKEGYVNLLLVQNKKSKQPGDSPEMIQARREFLNAGHYECLAQALHKTLESQLNKDTVVLDLGCGEGYYTRYIQNRKPFTLYGIDISKTAIRYAAKQNNIASYAVANAFNLPFANNSVDIVLQIYAYGKPEEIKRVLKPNGRYIIVSPATNHLLELKERIYDKVQTHKASEIPKDFEVIEIQKISETIIPDTKARTNLLKMTPFYWATTEYKKNNLLSAEPFEITLDFTISHYK